MPKNPIDYSKTIIYKICCKDPTITDIYVGHTTDLTKRRYSHKNRCCNPNNKKYNYYIYDFIRNNGNWDNWILLKIEDYNCNNHEEALKRERYWLEELKASLNKNIPSRDMKEWRKDNKEHEKEYRIKYYEDNKLELQEKARDRKKIYYENHKDFVLRKKECLCGAIVCINSFNRHIKTIKHQNFITSQSF